MSGQPIAFVPLFMERVWGGRRLAEVYGKPLPDGAVIGESWELVDREEAQSVTSARAGPTLHALWTGDREAVFGARGVASDAPRFPILIKLLDAEDTLSVQVHPPDAVAPELGGEPKNEMWFLAATRPGAHLYAGLRAGVDRTAFETALEAGEDVSTMLHRIDVAPGAAIFIPSGRVHAIGAGCLIVEVQQNYAATDRGHFETALHEGRAADLVQRLAVETGDAIFIPSGRIHAIGSGCLIVEIQQNSDTTYRVFDFNRPGLDGEMRELHVPQSMRSIDFADVEPPLADGAIVTPFFETERWSLEGERAAAPDGECAVIIVLAGDVACGDATFAPGDLFLVPAADPPPLRGTGAALLRVLLPA